MVSVLKSWMICLEITIPQMHQILQSNRTYQYQPHLYSSNLRMIANKIHCTIEVLQPKSSNISLAFRWVKLQAIKWCWSSMDREEWFCRTLRNKLLLRRADTMNRIWVRTLLLLKYKIKGCLVNKTTLKYWKGRKERAEAVNLRDSKSFRRQDNCNIIDSNLCKSINQQLISLILTVAINHQMNHLKIICWQAKIF